VLGKQHTFQAKIPGNFAVLYISSSHENKDKKTLYPFRNIGTYLPPEIKKIYDIITVQ
jgi:hypothetical protein